MFHMHILIFDPKMSFIPYNFNCFISHDIEMIFVECALVFDTRININFSVELVQPSKSLLYSLRNILLNNLILLKVF